MHNSVLQRSWMKHYILPEYISWVAKAKNQALSGRIARYSDWQEPLDNSVYNVDDITALIPVCSALVSFARTVNFLSCFFSMIASKIYYGTSAS